MKLFVTGSFVDLDFETTPPLKLSQKFATSSVAHSAARAIAIMLRLETIEICSGYPGLTKQESIKNHSTSVTSIRRKKQRRVKANAR